MSTTERGRPAHALDLEIHCPCPARVDDMRHCRRGSYRSWCQLLRWHSLRPIAPRTKVPAFSSVSLY